MNMKKLLTEKWDNFKKYISTGRTYQEVYDAYDKFFHWLLNKINDTSTDEEENLLLTTLYKLFSSSTKWAASNGVIFKSYSKQWNWRLVKRVGTFVNECENASRNGLVVLTERRMIIFSNLLNEMMDSNADFGTVAYCAQMMQQGKFINFKDLAEHVSNPTKNEKMDIGDSPFLGDPYKEMVFRHYYTGELMTIDQCIDSGGDPFDLIHIGGDLDGLPIRPKIIEKVTGLNIYQLVEKYPAKITTTAEPIKLDEELGLEVIDEKKLTAG